MNRLWIAHWIPTEDGLIKVRISPIIESLQSIKLEILQERRKKLYATLSDLTVRAPSDGIIWFSRRLEDYDVRNPELQILAVVVTNAEYNKKLFECIVDNFQYFDKGRYIFGTDHN